MRAAPAARDIPHRPPLNWKRSSQGDRFLFGPSAWDSNPTGCGAEETRSVFQRSTRGAKRRSGARAAPAAHGHPSSPTTELLGLQRWRPFLFRAHRRGIRTRQHVCHKGCGQKMAKMSTVTNFVAAIFGFHWVNLALNQRFEVFASCFPINITEHVWSN